MPRFCSSSHTSTQPCYPQTGSPQLLPPLLLSTVSGTILQEVQLVILGIALSITLYNALVLEPSAVVALEEELVRTCARVHAHGWVGSCARRRLRVVEVFRVLCSKSVRLVGSRAGCVRRLTAREVSLFLKLAFRRVRTAARGARVREPSVQSLSWAVADSCLLLLSLPLRGFAPIHCCPTRVLYLPLPGGGIGGRKEEAGRQHEGVSRRRSSQDAGERR